MNTNAMTWVTVCFFIKFIVGSKSGHNVSMSIYFGSPGHQIPELYLICLIINTTAGTGHTAIPGHECEHQDTREHQVTHGDPGHGVRINFFMMFKVSAW